MPRSSAEPPEHLRLGREGERHAVAALQTRGYELIEMNWHCAAGELDAVMRDGEELVFVEVKTRVGAPRGSAEEALTPAKASKLGVASEWYLSEHPELGDPIWRIDLVAITLDHAGQVVRFTHIANAAVTG